ncbi:MAG: peptidyl-prolyl cis-trans isomerase [Rubrivivax sp.]|nr:peptidyl-prolyl cis-trans isomerase [Rubrivivax sp.]
MTPTTPPDADTRRGPCTWLREPLLHFVLIGALLFAADGWLNSRQDDPRTIVIDAAVDQQAIEVFKNARGKAPNEDELYALRRVWLDNEVLYREGLALQMDKGDAAIKDRVIFKALSMINAGLKLPPFDDASLRAWFENNRARYDEPARYDFQEAVLAGDSPEAAARAFADALNAGTPGDAKAGLRVFKGRPQQNIEQSYGADFTLALAAQPVGRWAALPQRDGWRVVRVEAVHPAQPASFESLRGVVLQDWKDHVMSEQRSAAVRVLAQKYNVRVEAAKP